MAIPVESFDSYADGDLNGKNGGTGWSGAWSGSTFYDVQGTVTHSSSTKAVEIVDQNSEYEISRSWTTGLASGIRRIAMRRKGGNNWRDGNYLYLWEGGSRRGVIYMRVVNGTSTGEVEMRVSGGSDIQIVGGLSADTWYECDIEWDCTTDQIRGRVDGGTWSSWVNFISNANGTTIDKESFYKGNVNGGTYNIVTTHYWDEMGDGEATSTFIPKIMMS